MTLLSQARSLCAILPAYYPAVFIFATAYALNGLFLCEVTMKLPRKQAAFLRESIEQWKRDGLLADAQAAQLAGTIVVQPFDWRRLAKYSF